MSSSNDDVKEVPDDFVQAQSLNLVSCYTFPLSRLTVVSPFACGFLHETFATPVLRVQCVVAFHALLHSRRSLDLRSLACVLSPLDTLALLLLRCDPWHNSRLTPISTHGANL